MWTRNNIHPTENMSDIWYEWETKRASLDFEIGKIESQLRSVEKRLELLRHDVTVSALCVVIPYGLLLLPQILSMLSYVSGFFSFLSVVLDAIYVYLLLLYIIFLPFSIYHVIKGILMFYYARQGDSVWQKPHLRSDFSHQNTEREVSYQTEAHKLNWILTKYYAYRNEMDQMKQDIEDGDFTLSYEETKNRLDQMAYYEEIKPANPFSGVLVKKTRMITFLLLGVILLTMYFICKHQIFDVYF